MNVPARPALEVIRMLVRLLLLAIMFVQLQPALAQAAAAECPADHERNAGLCYPKCKAGYAGVGPVCWAQCPPGYSDIGAFCQKSAAYGRGAGYPWKFGDKPLSLDAARARCSKDNPQGCEKSGEIIYPVCRPGYTQVGCCLCSPVCPAGFTDTGTGCTKPSYGRTAGVVPTSLGGSCNISYPTKFSDGSPRRLNEVAYLTAHNAFANSDDTWIHTQQTFRIKTQLAGGVRALMLDIHYYDVGGGVKLIKLCHESCTGAAGSNYVEPRMGFAAGLQPVKEFLDANPNEIITIILESSIDNAALVRDEFVKAGLEKYLYDPEDDADWNVGSKKQWPTVDWMIAKGKRLVVTSGKAGDSATGVVGVARHYSVAVENSYDLGATGKDNACTKRAESVDLSDRTKLFVMNNFRSLPNLIAASEDNRHERIMARVKDLCMPAAKRPPNYLAVDFYQHPNCGAANAVAEINTLWEKYRGLGVPWDIEEFVFDTKFYRALSPELATRLGASFETEAAAHWMNNGLKRGRMASVVFDPVYYLSTNADLRQALGPTNYEAATRHWIEFGIKEGRRGSFFFDVKYFLKENPNLALHYGVNYLGAMQFWLNGSLATGSRGSADFDGKSYLARYDDLKKAFGSDYRTLMAHFVTYGQKEGRRAVP